MLQRLGIADALVKDPDVLILDEPTTAIDPLGVVEILDLLRRLVRERGLAVLLSSHLLDQVQSVCDRVGIFAAGQLIGAGHGGRARRRGSATARRARRGRLRGRRRRPAASASRERPRGRSRASTEVRPPARRRRAVVVVVGDRGADAADVREAILAVAAEHGLRLSSIREVEPSLDDIYRARGRAGPRPPQRRWRHDRRADRAGPAAAHRPPPTRATAAVPRAGWMIDRRARSSPTTS